MAFREGSAFINEFINCNSFSFCGWYAAALNLREQGIAEEDQGE
jgi:hypothetical protein